MAQWEKPVKTDVACTELIFLSTEKFTEEQCRRENSRDRARQGTGSEVLWVSIARHANR